MKKIFTKLLVVIIPLMIINCTPPWIPYVEKRCYGIQSLGGRITNITLDDEGLISYNTTGKVDKNIVAFVSINEFKNDMDISVTIQNKGNYPIQLNYFSDNYTLIDYNNKEYLITFDIMRYPSDPLNPGDSVYINSNRLISTLKAKDIKSVYIVLGLDSILIQALPYKTILKDG